MPKKDLFGLQTNSRDWRKLFYPVVFFMKFFGLSNTLHREDGKIKKKSKKFLRIFKLNSRFFEILNTCIIGWTLWLFFFFAAYQIYTLSFNKPKLEVVDLFIKKYSESSISNIFIVICSHTFCNAMIIVLFGFTKRSKHMREIFITLWEDTGSRPDSVRIHKMESIATTQKLYCFVLYPIIATTFISSLVKFYLSIFDECIEIWDDMNVHVAYAILITITVYAMSITVISAIYFMLICDLTTERLNEIARDIEKMSSVEEVIKRLEEVMRRHQKICDLIWSMDEFFSVFIFINYLVCIPESCLLLYQFFIVDDLKPIIGLWAFGDIMNLTIISLYAASVTISVSFI
ncbi:uncharacterized protein LOC111642699 [Centruroides sculpturatus]|uniref:uncharacterized protein LOC111642699 n=1 Tax=Centruroides sculpturatus TaxID=218467 RepID=UPI000C6D67D2|nr:uncharacterized protein LOC111642699 [Centruroides sculpturatus]